MKKFLLASLLLFSVHAFACGGDPSLGQFTCDTDSIRVTYGFKELQNNKWINPNASPSDTFVSGPTLNIEPETGSFTSVQLTGRVTIFNAIFQQGRLPYSCNQVRHIFDIALTAKDVSNNPVTLSVYPVSTTGMFAVGGDGHTGVCILNGGSSARDLSFPFIFDFQSGQYKDFQIKVINLNLTGIDGVDDWISYGIRNFNIATNDSWYLQLVGIR